MRRDIEQIALALSRRRKYAAFFDGPDKDAKELRVVRELVESLEANADYRLADPRLNRPDPPDCVCSDAMGNLVALEVVELVSEEAARLNAQGQEVYRDWCPGDVEAELRRLLKQKDEKTFHGGPYSETAVLVFTDEPALTFGSVKDELEGVTFGPYAQIDRAFLMFSYVPKQGYPVVSLRLDA